MKSHLLFALVALSSGCSPNGGASPAPVASSAGASTFFATVTSIDMGDVSHPYLRYTVRLKVDQVVSGPSPGDGFWFAIHSPSQSDIKVGQSYKIVAEKQGDGYEIISRDLQSSRSVPPPFRGPSRATQTPQEG